MLGNWKLWTAAAVAAIGMGLAQPAAATNCLQLGQECDVTSVSTGVGDGNYNNSGEFAGLINFSITGVGIVSMYCDDKNHYVNTGGINPPYTYYVEDANYYLMGSASDGNATGLDQATANEIYGLAYYGSTHTGNAEIVADIGWAIWYLEGTASAAPNTLATIAAYAAQGFADMKLAGLQAYQFEDPSIFIGAGQGQLCATPGTITFQSTCNTQGQLVFLKAPEPASIALMGTGLIAAAGAIRRRRKQKAAKAA